MNRIHVALFAATVIVAAPQARAQQINFNCAAPYSAQSADTRRQVTESLFNQTCRMLRPPQVAAAAPAATPAAPLGTNSRSERALLDLFQGHDAPLSAGVARERQGT